MMSSDGPGAIRQALRDLPILAAHSTGVAPDPSRIYFPENHADALDSDVALVIGNRGMGKSFWASALVDTTSRKLIGDVYFGRSRAFRSRKLDVRFGFADAEGASGAVSRRQLESAELEGSPELIWRAVIFRELAKLVGLPVPERFFGQVKWLSENLEASQELLRKIDLDLANENRQVLLLFDQLEQLGTEWPKIQSLTQGLLKTALAMRSYRSVRIKIFMRPDQAENKELFRFPDAAKISGSSVRLRWRPTDLYGLLFVELWRDVEAQTALRQYLGANRFRLPLPNETMPRSLSSDVVIQKRLFERIAGEYMGSGPKRGRPYTWITVHLADGRLEISPRTFLKVIKTAADFGTDRRTSIDYMGIQEGVRQASENRLNELAEDYPWVEETLTPLRGLLVPAERSEIVERWSEGDVVRNILNQHAGMSAPLDLALHYRKASEEESSDLLLTLLSEIGVIEPRANGKINVPDIFRVNAGIRRRGGVTPEQRRKLG